MNTKINLNFNEIEINKHNVNSVTITYLTLKAFNELSEEDRLSNLELLHYKIVSYENKKNNKKREKVERGREHEKI